MELRAELQTILCGQLRVCPVTIPRDEGSRDPSLQEWEHIPEPGTIGPLYTGNSAQVCEVCGGCAFPRWRRDTEECSHVSAGGEELRTRISGVRVCGKSQASAGEVKFRSAMNLASSQHRANGAHPRTFEPAVRGGILPWGK